MLCSKTPNTFWIEQTLASTTATIRFIFVILIWRNFFSLSLSILSNGLATNVDAKTKFEIHSNEFDSSVYCKQPHLSYLRWLCVAKFIENWPLVNMIPKVFVYDSDLMNQIKSFWKQNEQKRIIKLSVYFLCEKHSISVDCNCSWQRFAAGMHLDWNDKLPNIDHCTAHTNTRTVTIERGHWTYKIRTHFGMQCNQ